MACFRKIDSYIHRDEKYRNLDDLDKLLFLTILTQSCLLSVGAMARNMVGLIGSMEPNTASKRFKKLTASFNRLIELGMIEHDPIGLIAVPKYLKYNPLPIGEKSEKGWRKFYDSLPECELKNRVVSRCEASISLPATSEGPSDAPSHGPSDTPSSGPSSPPCDAVVKRSIVERKFCKFVIGEKFVNCEPRQGSKLTPDSEEVQKVVKAVVAMWPPYDDEQVKQRTSKKGLRENVTKILNEHGEYEPDFLVSLAEYYIEIKKAAQQKILAPQYFFGQMKSGARPWEERVDEILTLLKDGGQPKERAKVVSAHLKDAARPKERVKAVCIQYDLEDYSPECGEIVARDVEDCEVEDYDEADYIEEDYDETADDADYHWDQKGTA